MGESEARLIFRCDGHNGREVVEFSPGENFLEVPERVVILVLGGHDDDVVAVIGDESVDVETFVLLCAVYDSHKAFGSLYQSLSFHSENILWSYVKDYPFYAARKVPLSRL